MIVGVINLWCLAMYLIFKKIIYTKQKGSIMTLKSIELNDIHIIIGIITVLAGFVKSLINVVAKANYAKNYGINPENISKKRWIYSEELKNSFLILSFIIIFNYLYNDNIFDDLDSELGKNIYILVYFLFISMSTAINISISIDINANHVGPIGFVTLILLLYNSIETNQKYVETSSVYERFLFIGLIANLCLILMNILNIIWCLSRKYNDDNKYEVLTCIDESDENQYVKISDSPNGLLCMVAESCTEECEIHDRTFLFKRLINEDYYKNKAKTEKINILKITMGNYMYLDYKEYKISYEKFDRVEYIKKK